MSIVIFGMGAGKDGNNTLLFSGVENLKEDAHEVSFTYFGESTQVTRRATFSRNRISGYAVQIE